MSSDEFEQINYPPPKKAVPTVVNHNHGQPYYEPIKTKQSIVMEQTYLSPERHQVERSDSSSSDYSASDRYTKKVKVLSPSVRFSSDQLNRRRKHGEVSQGDQLIEAK